MKAEKNVEVIKTSSTLIFLQNELKSISKNSLDSNIENFEYLCDTVVDIDKNLLIVRY